MGYQFKLLRGHMEPSTAQPPRPAQGAGLYRHLCKVLQCSSLATTCKLGEKSLSRDLPCAVCLTGPCSGFT